MPSLARRLRGHFWDRSRLVRRPLRRVRRELSLLAYRWRSWRGSGEPPRVVTDLATAEPPALPHPAVAIHLPEDDGAARAWLAGQTETSWQIVSADAQPGEHGPAFWLTLGDAAPDAPPTLVESLVMAAAAEDLSLVVGGWTSPAPGRFGPSGQIFPFGGNLPCELLRVAALRSSKVFGRAVGHIHAAPSQAGQSLKDPWLTRGGPYLLAPGSRPGTVLRRPVVDLDAALAHLPETPGPRTALFVLPFLAVGGAEHLLFDLLDGLRERYRTLVVTVEPHLEHLGQTVDACRELTPHVYTLGDWLPREALGGALRHLIRRYRVETLVCWNGSVEFYDRAADLKREFPGLRLLNQLYNHEGGWIEHYGPAFAAAIDLHLAVNGPIAGALEREHGVPTDRIRLVPHGVRVPAELPDGERRQRRAASRRALGLPRDALVVGTFVRLHPQKRPLDVLRLARRFSGREGPEVHFVLAGSGPLDDAVDRELETAPLPNLLRLPMQRDVEPLFDAVDLCLSTSSYEGLPVFLLESLARAVPCVATGAGDIPDLLRDGGGVVVDTPGDLDALEAGVERLLASDYREREGRRGRKTVLERFSVEAYRDRYEPLIFPDR